VGYRGKVKEQEKARALRAQNRTLADIAQTLGVSKSSVSLWFATSRSRRPSDCVDRTGARIPRTKQSSARSRS
jgi:transcriptional regulator with XRE-family HTH domain